MIRGARLCPGERKIPESSHVPELIYLRMGHGGGGGGGEGNNNTLSLEEVMDTPQTTHPNQHTQQQRGTR